MDRFVSCIALLLLVLGVAVGTTIFTYQCLNWLQTDVWPPMPLELLIGFVRSLGSSWVGLQRIYGWFLALPLVVGFYLAGLLAFWLGGVISAALYKRAAHAQSKMVTPAQTHT
jgi:hypothetical protein